MKRLFIISMIICGFWCGISAQIAGNYFPKMKPVETAVFLSVGGATESAEALHSCRIFQGIINRDSAELFLTTGDKEMDWWRYLNPKFKRPANGVIVTGENRGLRTLFKSYKDRLDKLVVCNFADNDYTFNMAVLMACAENALPVSEKLKDELIAEFGWDKEVVDIRNQWATITQAYNWALEEIMPKLNKQLVFSAGLRDDWRNGGWRIYDYAVASRSFVFWVDDETTTGKNIIKKILNTPGYPKNAVVMGYGMHGDDLNLRTNPEGFGFVVSDFFPNGSFYSSFPTETFERYQPEGVAREAETNKVYVALHWSDGDNIMFNHNATLNIWNQKERGQVPVSMTLSPASTEIAPFILRYYYETMTENDEFIGGPSGAQYIQEPYYKPEDYESWCVMNGEYLKAAGFYSTASSLRWPAQPFYNNGFVKCGVTGTLAWTSGAYHDAYNWCGMPVVAVGGVCGEENGIYNYLKGVDSRSEFPVFTGVYLVQAGMGGPGYAAINRVSERLQSEYPDKYVFLKASDLLATAKKYFTERQKPFKALSIPGRIEAEDFDLGGQGAGFYDTARRNEGGAYRTEPDDFVGVGVGGSGYHIGWTDAGEWLNYTVDVNRSATYKLTLRYATPAGVNKGVCVMLDDTVLSTVELKATSGVNDYADHAVYVTIPEGKHNLRVQIISGGMNLDYYDFEEVAESIPEISRDKGYKITAVHSGKALALVANNTTNGTKIIQKEYTGDKTEIWKLNVAGDACFSLQNVASGLSIVLRGTNTLGQFPFDCTVNNGKWNLYYQGDGCFTIAQKGALKNLEIQNASIEDNAELTIGDPTGNANQLFRLEEVANYAAIESVVSTGNVGAAYPNPFTDNLYIPVSVQQAQPAEISLFDLSGRCVYRRTVYLTDGQSDISLCGDMLSGGIYVWQLAGDSIRACGRVMKK